MLHVDPDLALAAAEGMPPARRKWRLPVGVVAFQDTYGDVGDSAHAALCDARRCGSLAWERAMGHPALAACAAVLAAGSEPDDDMVDDACEAMAEACGAAAVSVRDGEDGGRRSRTATLVGAANVYDLVDVTLSFPPGAMRLRGSPAGLSWTGHAVQRFYERTGGRAVASETFGAAVSRERALLRLACEVATANGLAGRVVLPCSEGLLLGHAWREFHDCGWARDVVARDGYVEVAEARARDAGPEWTAMTYVAPPFMRAAQASYGARWESLGGLPAVRALQVLAGLPGARPCDLAEARADAMVTVAGELIDMLAGVAPQIVFTTA